MATTENEQTIRGLRAELERLRTEMREREQERGFFKHLLESSQDPFYIIDPAEDFRFTYVNAAACRHYGRDRDELLAMRIPDWDPLFDDARCHTFWTELRQKRSVTLETVHYHAEGREIPVEVSANVFSIAGREVFGGWIRDISARKRSEAALRASEALARDSYAELDQIYRYAPVGLFTFDREYRFQRINEMMAEINGFPPEYHIGRTIDEILPDLADFLKEAYLPVLERGEPILELEIHGITPKAPNTPRDWLGSYFPLYSGTGEIVGLIGAVLEVTERRQAKQQLRSLAAVVENSDAFIGLATPDMQPLFVNEAGRRMAGLASMEQVRQTPIMDYFWPEDLPLIENEALPALFREGHWTGEVRLRNFRTGAPIYNLWNGFLVRDEAGQTVAWAVISQDLTARKRLENDLQKSKDAAEDASRAKSEFLANMSHEIRTPLNGMFGMLQILQTTALSAEQSEYVAIALDSGQNLLTVLSDILDLSRIEANRMTLVNEPFSVAQTLQGVVGIFLKEAGKKGLRLTHKLEGDVPEIVRGDEGRLRQVLFNLAGNAVKFTERGEIAIHAAALPDREEGEHLQLAFTVEDTGIGIPEDRQEEIFDAFTQAEGSYSRRYGGSGLGLAIVKRLVALMDGHIELHSEENQGTRVHFTVRVETVPDTAEMKLQAEPAITPLQPCRILIVEDEPVNRLALKRLLQKRGHSATTANDGQECLDALETETFDLIFMDIQMPGMDGMEATRRIRALPDPQKAGLPIVALTAHAMKGDEEKFLGAGMDAYLSKPVNMEELVRILERLIV